MDYAMYIRRGLASPERKMMNNTELDEMREKIARHFGSATSGGIRFRATDRQGINLEFADQILSLETSNGYSLKEMIEFFGKIKRDTQREAVVRKKAELPQCPEKAECQLTVADMDKRGVKPEDRNRFIVWVRDFRHAYITALQDTLAKHFEQEVRE